MIYELVKDGPAQGLWECQGCFALVRDTKRHSAWHTNVIGGLQNASDPRTIASIAGSTTRY
jgi:hypothetical protein